MIPIARHRTALSRIDLSRPLKTAQADGLLNTETSVLDYGCGRGGDVRYLRHHGYQIEGWDPVHAPGGKRTEADLVNLGYVVNVIENPAERRQVLEQAWNLARRVLVVSARLTGETPDVTAPFADGLLTRIGTFQKFFDQQELRNWIDQCLQVQSVAAAPGVFYAFRDPVERASFMASRFRRATAAPRLRADEKAFLEHRTLLESLAVFIGERGRLPAPDEFADFHAVEAGLGSLQRAYRVLEKVSDREAWSQVRQTRIQDLLVFLALSQFDARPKASDLPLAVLRDVKAFFGTYAAACRHADELLLSIGDPALIRNACETSSIGKRLPTALYIHINAVPELPLLLRLYEGCARGYVGSVVGANIVKLNHNEPKVSYLCYPNFENDPHPALLAGLSVHLREFRVRQQSYRDHANPPILHRKEEFVSGNHPARAKFERLTKAEVARGLYADPARIGTRNGWNRELSSRGLMLRGHRLVRIESQRPSA